MDCLVCEYRRDGFEDGPTYSVHPATHTGVILLMDGAGGVCEEHLSWVTDEFPETLRPIEEAS